MHGYPIAAGVVLGIIAMRLWHYHKAPRIQAFLFTAAAFLLTVGVTVWLDALAGLTATGTGLTVLLVVIVLGGLAFWYEVIKKHKHHVIWTPVVGIVFGTAVVLGFALWPTLVHKAVKAAPKSSAALAQAVTQVQSGKAATALTAGQQHEYLLMGGGALVLLVIVAFKFEKGKRGASSKGTPPAITSGRSGSTRPSGRPAITSGRRR